MSPAVLLAAEGGEIHIGKHWTVSLLGFTLNLDTIIATLVAGAIVIGLGLWVARRASVGKPTKLQIAFEVTKEQIEQQVEDNLGIRTAPWVVPFAFAIALLILFSNLLAILPSEEWLPPPTADVNLTFGLSFVVMLAVWFTAIKRHPVRFFAHFKNPMAIIEEITKPISLSLRLFGNVLSGVIMIQLIILLFPVWLFWVPFTAWKLFDIFIAVLQAVIFTILTIIYFGQALAEESDAH
ncbi:F0F1 ATP synthase subunit A [Pseudonocardia asaccharolytica]|uniref:ATP synthase subunit a n=1 Tax=Pseudonocardia asaccharolytica DSM 44247 = NBRC 16224 TaxID=1123024 RepID=A0A511CYA9_9PSEU|nr:F0F1 ATP synthase subunit A [Pseudonocardia asaccharolytica]GEL17546.1 ATP synthase subunit a [Pseudonocardia asaccharolytica DSM 44247 = NBRC 16224]